MKLLQYLKHLRVEEGYGAITRMARRSEMKLDTLRRIEWRLKRGEQDADLKLSTMLAIKRGSGGVVGDLEDFLP